MLKNITLRFLVTFLIAGNAFAQQSYKGTIIDSKTKSPVPYASIKVNHKKTQSIANADGRFSLSSDLFLVRDTIIISCVGYRPKSVPVKSLAVTPVIKLDPVIFQLTAVDVKDKGNLDYPYQLFSELCKKYRRYGATDHARGYYSYLSRYDDLPLEIIEGYYNGDVTCGNGIARLSLKNGRIGLCPNSFYSLNTTDILTHFSPFSLSGNLNIPSSAGNFSFHRLKNLFDLRIIRTSVEDGNKECILQLLPRKDSMNLFSGLAWINRTENTIEKLEYFINCNDFFYLKPVIKGDISDSIKLSMVFTFDNSVKEHPVISKVSLDYSLRYSSLRSSNKLRINCEANLFFYDYDNLFAGTYPAGLVDTQDNDYQKISCLPYDSLFWSSPGITPQSDKQKLFIDYFRTYGVLVNFSKTLDSIAGSNYIRWNAGSCVAFSDILNRRPSAELYRSSPGVIPAGKLFGTMPYYIICKILINPVAMGDSLHLSSITLLDKMNSYYFLGRSMKSTAFINLTFDLYEQERREIIARCKQANRNHRLTPDEFQSIYSTGLKQLNDTLKIFNDETANGTSVGALVKWYHSISMKMGTDRSVLIGKLVSESVH
jgi:hypothetical protein